MFGNGWRFSVNVDAPSRDHQLRIGQAWEGTKRGRVAKDSQGWKTIYLLVIFCFSFLLNKCLFSMLMALTYNLISISSWSEFNSPLASILLLLPTFLYLILLLSKNNYIFELVLLLEQPRKARLNHERSTILVFQLRWLAFIFIVRILEKRKNYIYYFKPSMSHFIAREKEICQQPVLMVPNRRVIASKYKDALKNV